MQVKESAQENWFNRTYKLRVKLSNNYTDLRPITSLVITARDWENGIYYINKIQQDLLNNGVIPFIIKGVEDYTKLKTCQSEQIRELLHYVWRSFEYNENK
jgi:hypothetical protein